MVLGSILTSPDDLETCLNRQQVVNEPFPQEETQDQTAAVRRFVRAELSRQTGGKLQALLPFSPIASAGGGVSADVSRRVESTVEVSGVHAVAVMPDAAKDYVDKALQTTKVQEHVRKGLFAQPLYMIVGVATCRKLNMGDSRHKTISGSLDLDSSLTVSGIQAGVGGSREKEISADSEAQIEEECDFAYRVREFQYSRMKRRIKKSSNVTDGAMFRKDGERGGRSSDEEDDVEEVPVFEHFESEDEDFA